MSGDTARTLADDLRRRDDDALAALLAHRPDLLHPVPSDLTALVSRASTSVSTARTLDRLDAWTLQVVEVLAALPEPASVDLVAAALPTIGLPPIRSALDAIRERALAWGPDSEIRLVRSVREAVGSWPCGLSGPGLVEFEPDEAASLMADAPDVVRAVVDQLLWGPPVGSVPNADRPVSERTAKTPIEWLLARRLLQPLNSSTVVLPREAAVPLRGGSFLRDPQPAPPVLPDQPARTPAQVAAAAGQGAFQMVRWVEDLLEQWSVAPPAQLRSGGLSVRDLTATARFLDVDEPTAALVAEVAHAAGLLASDEEESPVWLPTGDYDLWLALATAERWSLLARAWLEMRRVPAMVGQRDERDGRINALSPALDRGDAPDVRRLVLAVLERAAPGVAVGAPDVAAALAWQRPRRVGRVRDLIVESSLREAEALGLTGLGALAPHGRSLLDPAAGGARRGVGARDAAAAALVPHLPEPLDHVLLQADLTAVAPGPLESAFARELGLLADVESTGGATVYRISAESLRRAFDAGRGAADVMAFLEARSRTPVPQPLAYLVDDVARRHGVVRVGPAGSYVRCDDEAALGALLADRRAAGLRASRLAPGVVVLQVSVDEALPVLRELGLAPAAESPDGTVVIRRPDSRRAPHRARITARATEPAAPDPLLVTAAVRALRAGDRIATGRRPAGPELLGRLPQSSPTETIAAVRAAIAEERSLWIGYADTDGRATERIIDPVEVSRGFLTAYDHRYEEVRSFALARITGVAELDDDQSVGQSGVDGTST